MSTTLLALLLLSASDPAATLKRFFGVVEELSASVAFDASAESEARQLMLLGQTRFGASDATIVEERIEGARATLRTTISLGGQRQLRTFELVREGDRWRLLSIFHGRPQSYSASAAAPSPPGTALHNFLALMKTAN